MIGEKFEHIVGLTMDLRRLRHEVQSFKKDIDHLIRSKYASESGRMH